MAGAPAPQHPRSMNTTSRSRLAGAIRDFASGVNTAHAIRHGTYTPPRPEPQPSRRWVSEYQFPLGSRKTASTP